ncbi:MAG: LysR family transcriptional regulator [Rhodobacteraceae bacterium]|nr:LysR family transcriptional regulator [Paracoccaceae bacterium]
MDIRTYAGFVAVADLSSVTLAADRLHLTQSALSRQIKALEDSLGIRLFEKAGRNLRLTPAGEALLGRVNLLLSAERSLRTFADDLKSDQAGLLRIGACSQLIERFLPAFLKRWTSANPGIDVRLEDGGGPELAERLCAGAVHLTIAAAPQTPIDSFEMVRLGRLAFLAAALPEFLPDTGQPIEMAELLAHPILTLNRRHASREVFDAACRLIGVPPVLVMESTSPHTLFAMAAGGNGVAVVPSSTRAAGTALVTRPIALKGEPVEFDICAMWDRRAPLPAYGLRFVEALGAHIRAEEAAESARQSLQRPHLHVV